MHRTLMCQGRPTGLAVRCVPELGGTIRAAGQYNLAIGTEAQCKDAARLIQRIADWLAGGWVPELGRTIGGPGQETLAIRTEGHGEDGAVKRMFHHFVGRL